MLLVLSKKREKKEVKSAPASLLIITLLLLLSILLAQFSQQRSYSLIAVVSMVIFSVSTVGLFSFLLWPFGKLDLFVSNRKSAVGRFFVLLFIYWESFVVTSQGLNFLFNGVVNPQVVILTPEFERYVVPTFSGLILVVYRLTSVLHSKTTEFLGEVAQDVIIFSLLMFWLRIVASAGGANIVSELPPISFEEGVLVGAFALGFEGFILWVRKDMSKYRRKFSFEEMVVTFSSQMFPKRKTRQTTLGDFHTERIVIKRNSELGKAAKRLDAQFSLKYRGRVLTASRVLSWIMYLALALAVGGMIIAGTISRPVVALVRAYSVEASIVDGDQLPQSAIAIVSEDVENLATGKVYAIAIVSIQTANASFEAPISRRYLSLNSSAFMVLETKEYLTVSLSETYVETNISVPLISHIAYDQRSDSSYNYIGFFREAEIFYCLARFGFNLTTTLSKVSLQGLVTVVQKIIYSSNGFGDSALIFIERRSETMTEEDVSNLQSLNENFMNQTSFLIQQTKVITDISEQVINATAPFKLLNNN